MIRSLVGLTVVTGLVLFGFYFVNDKSNGTTSEKARHALSQTGDTVVDQGIAAAVNIKIASTFGVNTARFLHTYNNDGNVVVYGLLDAGITNEQLAQKIRELPGVKSVTVHTCVLPEELKPAPSIPQPAADPQPPAGAATRRP